MAAIALALAIMAIQAPKANADPLCAEVSYTVLGTYSNSVGHCQSTPWSAGTVDRNTGVSGVVEVGVFISLPLP